MHSTDELLPEPAHALQRLGDEARAGKGDETGEGRSGGCTMKPIATPFLTTAEAAEYLRYRSASAVRTLKMLGKLRPAGRRGKIDLYRREDLDRFVLSQPSTMMAGGR